MYESDLLSKPSIKVQFEVRHKEKPHMYLKRVKELRAQIKKLVKRSNAYTLIFVELVLDKPNTKLKMALREALFVLDRDTAKLRKKTKLSVPTPSLTKNPRALK